MQGKTHPAKRADRHPTSTELAKAKPVPLPSENKEAANPTAKAARAHPLANDAFWKRPQLTKVWDVAHLKPDDERRLRDDLHELIVRFNPLVGDPSPWLSRVEDAGDPFLKTLHRKEIKYKYFILDSDVVNAFSIPGGYVYISRGLFDLIGEDEDYALQFAIGHEIAHVDDEHAIKCLRDPGVMKMPEGTLQKLFTLILPFGYLRNESVDPEFDQEFEADEWVANRMQRLGRTRRDFGLSAETRRLFQDPRFLRRPHQAPARPRFVPARKPLPRPDRRPYKVEALEGVHGSGRERPEMNTASAASPISIDPRAIASALTPIRSEPAGKNSSARSRFRAAPFSTGVATARYWFVSSKNSPSNAQRDGMASATSCTGGFI